MYEFQEIEQINELWNSLDEIRWDKALQRYWDKPL